jgi:hypothetical protein
VRECVLITALPEGRRIAMKLAHCKMRSTSLLEWSLRREGFRMPLEAVDSVATTSEVGCVFVDPPHREGCSGFFCFSRPVSSRL